MNLVTRNMTAADAALISGWTYEPPYELYNMGVSEESISELTNGSYRVVTRDGETIGFYCIGDAAQVPAGHRVGAYENGGHPVADVGIGMRPDLTGQGLGGAFLSYVLRVVCNQHPQADLRLTVATFNKRAIKLYERLGFEPEVEFDSNGTTFQTMKRTGKLS